FGQLRSFFGVCCCQPTSSLSGGTIAESLTDQSGSWIPRDARSQSAKSNSSNARFNGEDSPRGNSDRPLPKSWHARLDRRLLFHREANGGCPSDDRGSHVCRGQGMRGLPRKYYTGVFCEHTRPAPSR